MHDGLQMVEKVNIRGWHMKTWGQTYAAAVLLLAGCEMNVDAQIEAIKKCEMNGLRAEVRHSPFDARYVSNVNCLPKP